MAFSYIFYKNYNRDTVTNLWENSSFYQNFKNGHFKLCIIETTNWMHFMPTRFILWGPLPSQVFCTDKAEIYCLDKVPQWMKEIDIIFFLVFSFYILSPHIIYIWIFTYYKEDIYSENINKNIKTKILKKKWMKSKVTKTVFTLKRKIEKYSKKKKNKMKKKLTGYRSSLFRARSRTKYIDMSNKIRKWR